MPGAEWFPGARLNYAEHVFRRPDPARARDARTPPSCARRGRVTWGELRAQVAAAAAGLRALGVGAGDRVVAYLPNIPEAIVAFLATASLGAIWSSCSPDFGARSVIDRFAPDRAEGAARGRRLPLRRQGLRPPRERRRRSAAALPSLRAHGRAPVPRPRRPLARRRARLGRAARARQRAPSSRFEPRPLRPPALGPLLLRHDRAAEGDRPRPRRDPARAPEEDAPPPRRPARRPLLLVHDDRLDDVELPRLRPADRRRDRALRRQPRPPGPRRALGPGRAEPGSPCFGTSAAFIAGLHEGRASSPATAATSSRLRAVGSTGSPLSPEGFDWVYERARRATPGSFSTRGGTDVCTAFVGGVPPLPVYRGRAAGPRARRRGRGLRRGRPAGHRRGRRARRSPSRCRRCRSSSGTTRTAAATARATSSMYPGVWRHGDWIEITDRGTARHLRPLRLDDQPRRRAHGHERDLRGGRGAARGRSTRSSSTSRCRSATAGCRSSSSLARRRRARRRRSTRGSRAGAPRASCSPRHVPDEVVAIAAVPRTLSGKVLEVPVKKILTGAAPEQAASRDSLANPAALAAFAPIGERLRRGEL